MDLDPDDDGLGQPLLNLSKVRSRMDTVGRFLSDALNTNTVVSEAQMEIVSKEITAAINQVIVNGAALLSGFNHSLPSTNLNYDLKKVPESDIDFNQCSEDHDDDNPTGAVLGFPKTEVLDDDGFKQDWDIVELDAVELLAEHLHFCDVCGKGFKRDANLRMHMRAHGNKFKTLEALTKPVAASESSISSRGVRFSCPFAGCSRNKLHKKFRPLKSVICVRNHFKRSHCPKMYACNRCNKKNFSVLADLKSHLKHCGDTKWKCSCGTSFSRKDKLFGHIALFQGHMPAMAVPTPQQDDDNPKPLKPGASDEQGMEWDMIFDGLGSIDDDFCIQDLIGADSNGGGIDWNL